jgi:MFS family permease
MLHDYGVIPRSLAPLREAQFRRLFFGRAFSMVGSNIVPIALVFAVLDLTGSTTDLGLVLGTRWLAILTLTLIGGVWSDRLPRHIVMLSADAARLVSQATMGVLLVTGHAQLWQLFATQAVAGAGDAFFNPASTGIVPHVVAPAGLQQANALLSLTASGTSILGPAIGGVLVAGVGSGWAFVADGASFAISAAFLASLRLPRAAEKIEAPNFFADLKEGWREFRSRTWMLVIDAWAVLANMIVIAPFFVLGPVISKRELGGAGAWALIVASFGVGSVAGDLTALVFKPRRPLLVGCLLITTFAIPLCLLAIPAPSLAIAAGSLLAAFGLNLFNTFFITTMQEQVPPAALSRVTSYDWVASVAFLPLGFALVGPLTQLVGESELLYAAAAFQVVAAAVMVSLPSVRDVRRREAGPSPADGPERPGGDLPAA